MLPLPYDVWIVRSDPGETRLSGHSSLEGWRRVLSVDDGNKVRGCEFRQGRHSLISEQGRVAIAGALGRSILDYTIRELRGCSRNHVMYESQYKALQDRRRMEGRLWVGKKKEGFLIFLVVCYYAQFYTLAYF